jgi:UDP-N-acetylglucosamine 2-epimerase
MNRRQILTLSIVGTRPQFMKLAPLIWSIRRVEPLFQHLVLHSGQHFDHNMSDIFLKEFDIGRPDIKLFNEFEEFDLKSMSERMRSQVSMVKPNLLIVYGDTFTTMAGAECGLELGIPVAHIEAGLRSFDLTMPEERIRKAVDEISEIKFAPTKTAIFNLNNENLERNSFLVGNIMIEALLSLLSTDVSAKSERSGFTCTLHRPANVDNSERLSYILNKLELFRHDINVYAHPRLKMRIEEFGLEIPKNLSIHNPLGYIEFIERLKNSEGLITDSGGLQNEAFVLGVPTLVVRENTEWPETFDGKFMILDPNLQELKSGSWPPQVRARTLPAKGSELPSESIIRILNDYLSSGHPS